MVHPGGGFRAPGLLMWALGHEKARRMGERFYGEGKESQERAHEGKG